MDRQLKDMYFNKEQIEEAKKVDIVSLVINNGYEVKKENNAYNIIGYGGLYIFGKNQDNTQGFYWHSKGIKGNAIDFCKEFFNDNYLKAIERLLAVHSVDTINKNKITNNLKNTVHSVDTIKEFKLPERDKEIKKAYAYLTDTRMISKKLVNDCIKYGIIRQFKEDKYTYVGFIGKDKNNKTKYLMLRSTLTGNNYKKEIKGSSKEYGFKIFNKETVHSVDNKINIHIFESPIDLLSYMTIFPKLTLNNNAFLSMGGISSKALNQFINDYEPNISQITICFDNDEAGINNANKIKKELDNKYKVIINKPLYKDYNEQLKAIRLNSTNDTLNNTIILKP